MNTDFLSIFEESELPELFSNILGANENFLVEVKVRIYVLTNFLKHTTPLK